MAISFDQGSVQLALVGDGVATQFTVDVDDLPLYVGGVYVGPNYISAKVLGDLASATFQGFQAINPSGMGITATVTCAGRRITITFSAPINSALFAVAIRYLSNAAPV